MALPDTDGLLTPEANRIWKMLGFLGAVAAATLFVSQLLGSPPARGSSTPPAAISQSDLAQRLDRIEAALEAGARAQGQQAAALDGLKVDMAVVRSQVQDLRAAQGLKRP